MTSADDIQLVTLELEKYNVSLQSTAITFEELVSRLAHYINELIVYDFHQLVTLLYRLDIPEEKLRYFLQKNDGAEAATLIAKMIIERQLEKIATRRSFKKDEDIPDEDRW